MDNFDSVDLFTGASVSSDPRMYFDPPWSKTPVLLLPDCHMVAVTVQKEAADERC